MPLFESRPAHILYLVVPFILPPLSALMAYSLMLFPAEIPDAFRLFLMAGPTVLGAMALAIFVSRTHYFGPFMRLAFVGSTTMAAILGLLIGILLARFPLMFTSGELSFVPQLLALSSAVFTLYHVAIQVYALRCTLTREERLHFAL